MTIIHNHTVNYTQAIKIFILVIFSSPTRWLLQAWFVMTQYCIRWITARWWWYCANSCSLGSPHPSRCVQATPRRSLYKWDRWYLLSSLFKFGSSLMYIAYLMPRARSSLSVSTILVLSQSMTWFSFTERSVRTELHISLGDCLFLSLVYTTALLTFSVSVWCSFTRTFSFHFVSPAY